MVYIECIEQTRLVSNFHFKRLHRNIGNMFKPGVEIIIIYINSRGFSRDAYTGISLYTLLISK